MNEGKSEIKTGIILNYVNQGLGNLIPFLYTPIMLTLLGQSEYGLYKLSSNITSYLALSALGMGSAVTRYLIKARMEEGEEAEAKMLGLFMAIFQLVAILAMIIGIVLIFNLHTWYGQSLSGEELHRMRILVFLMTCNTALAFSLSPYISVVTTHERFIFLQVMNILTTCIGPMANIVVLYLGYGSIGMATASMILGILTRLWYCLYVRRSLAIKARYRGMPLGQLREIIVFSFWIFVGNVVGQLFDATDTVLIGAVSSLGTMGVAVYSIGLMFNTITIGLTTGVSNLTAPRVNKMVFSDSEPTQLTEFAVKVGRIQGYIISLIASGFIVFGKDFIHLYTKPTGDDYSDAYWIALFIIIPNIIPLMQSVCLNVVIARNQHRFRSIVYLAIAILNVIGTWFMIHTSLGIIGAAIMTGIALIAGQGFAMNWYYWKKTEIELGKFWKGVSKVMIVPVAMAVLGVAFGKWVDFSHIPVFLTGVIVYTLVYFILNWIFIFNSYEKNLILSPLNKYIIKDK